MCIFWLCSLANKRLCACCPPQLELRIPFRWKIKQKGRPASVIGMEIPIIYSNTSMDSQILNPVMTCSYGIGAGLWTASWPTVFAVLWLASASSASTLLPRSSCLISQPFRWRSSNVLKPSRNHHGLWSKVPCGKSACHC